jgi:DNA polymerase elongation subunit (family B)
MRYAEKEESEERRRLEREEAIKRLNLWPLTAQVVTIAMMNVESERGRILYQSRSREKWFSGDGQAEFASGSEAEILEEFWKTVSKYDKFISFNGRGFDCPFLMLRSAILGVKPTRNLMSGTRFNHPDHIDLMEEFTYFGTTRKFNLDFYCKSFGIESPKSHGVTGMDVNRLFAEGEHRRIAEYCLCDVKATAKLYRRWEEYLEFE